LNARTISSMGTETKLEENFGKAGGRDLTRAVMAMARRMRAIWVIVI
jgi:hypothetical protein